VGILFLMIFTVLLSVVAFAHYQDHGRYQKQSGFDGIGKCTDDCETFVNCLFDTKNNYTEGHNQVKARDLTWDCLWSIDDSWAIENNLHEATTCSMKVYENAERQDVEDCFADNLYTPAFGSAMGQFMFQIFLTLICMAQLIAICCAHSRCYKAPTTLRGTGFSCCKFCFPLASVISVDRYQNSTAIAALMAWCGCVYTLCCWKPNPVELQVNGAVQQNNYNNFGNNNQQQHNNNWVV